MFYPAVTHSFLRVVFLRRALGCWGDHRERSQRHRYQREGLPYRKPVMDPGLQEVKRLDTVAREKESLRVKCAQVGPLVL